jgi:uncharacterized protein (DUF983 family)
MQQDHAVYPPQDPFATGLTGRCPRCGEGRLFQGLLSVAPACSACGLDYAFADSADGPAVFVILILGFVIAGAALVTELAYSPPIWVHVILWGPLVILSSLALLRPLKGVLVALQYVNKAKEGEIERSP